MNSRLYPGHFIQSNSSTVAYGASLFDGKLVRILIEKLSDVIDLAEKFFPLGLVESHRNRPSPYRLTPPFSLTFSFISLIGISPLYCVFW
jgi:hypothetical protein